MSNRQYYVYIATNQRNTVLYTGVTNNLERRMFEHVNKLAQGFTANYNVNKLVWYEVFDSSEEAIDIEKKIKGWTRLKKIGLIRKTNPDFNDLLKKATGSFGYASG